MDQRLLDLNKIFKRKMDEASVPDQKIKIRYRDFCQELKIYEQNEIDIVLNFLSSRIFMYPNQDIFDHDIPEKEMERAKIFSEKQFGIVTAQDKKKFFMKNALSAEGYKKYKESLKKK
tara:strand:- start:1698 stop:2051 length:354 start_codon:yes stop_codon:yes gene_type:complete